MKGIKWTPYTAMWLMIIMPVLTWLVNITSTQITLLMETILGCTAVMIWVFLESKIQDGKHDRK